MSNKISVQAVSYATADIASNPEKGSAFTLNIPVKVTAELTEECKISGIPAWMKKTALETLSLVGYDCGLKIKIENEIPEGLGREESVSLALTFAIAGAIAKKYGSINELKIDKFLSEQFLMIGEKIFEKEKLLELCINTNKKLKFEKLVASFCNRKQKTKDFAKRRHGRNFSKIV